MLTYAVAQQVKQESGAFKFAPRPQKFEAGKNWGRVQVGVQQVGCQTGVLRCHSPYS